MFYDICCKLVIDNVYVIRGIAMIVKVLAENTSCSDEFMAEHGLSLYIETEKHKLLFDLGQSDIMFDNAEKLGVDIKSVDTVVISHAHYDHTGGLKTFLELNKKAVIYLNENVFGDYFSGNRYIGMDKSMLESDRIIFTQDKLEIDEELFVFTVNKVKLKHKTYSHQSKLLNGNIVEDDYKHEQYLLVKEKSQISLISGCSHKGILNIIDFAKEHNADNIVGGFHLKDFEKYDNSVIILRDLALRLNACKRICFYTCHCTGILQYDFLKKAINNRLNYISTGTTIKI